jgi:hypothetical protein
MGCGGTDEEIARVLIFMAHRGRVILHDAVGAPLFGSAELLPLRADLPRPPALALVIAMHAEGLLDVIAADTRDGRVIYALTAEGRRAARIHGSTRSDAAPPRIVDFRAERKIAEAQHRIVEMRCQAEAMEERFREQRALIRRMRQRRLNTELAEERLGTLLIGLIEIHQQILLSQQSCAAQQTIRFRATARTPR